MSDILKPESVDQLADIVSMGFDSVVLFTAPSWCQPCRKFAPHFEAAAERSDVQFVYASLDTVPEFSESFKIQSVPTLRFYRADGEVTNISGRTALAVLHEIEDLTD